MRLALRYDMHPPLCRADSTERTIALGPLDLFPAGHEEATLTDTPPSIARLETGIPVVVVGASVVFEAKRARSEEEAFVMKPSPLLRWRRAARDAIAGAWARVRSSRAPRAAGALVAERWRELPSLVAADLALVRAAAARVASSARALDAKQRRLAAGSFAAGLAVASCVALIV